MNLSHRYIYNVHRVTIPDYGVFEYKKTEVVNAIVYVEGLFSEIFIYHLN